MADGDGKVLNTDDEKQDPALLLSEILNKSANSLEKESPGFIIKAPKMSNKALNIYVENLRDMFDWEDSKILKAIIAMDRAIEEGVVDSSTLSNPELIKANGDDRI